MGQGNRVWIGNNNKNTLPRITRIREKDKKETTKKTTIATKDSEETAKKRRLLFAVPLLIRVGRLFLAVFIDSICFRGNSRNSAAELVSWK